jgi:hypothetical protein
MALDIERVVDGSVNGQKALSRCRPFEAWRLALGADKELGRMLPGMQVHLMRVQFRCFFTMQDEMRSNDYQWTSDAILKGKSLHSERSFVDCCIYRRRLCAT